MKTSDSTKKSLLIGFATALFILAVFAPFYVKAPSTEGSVAPPPLQVGTNRITIGANVYQSNGYHFGAVVEIDEWYDFPDGTNRPGVLVRATNGYETWIPREKMNRLTVAQ